MNESYGDGGMMVKLLTLSSMQMRKKSMDSTKQTQKIITGNMQFLIKLSFVCLL